MKKIIFNVLLFTAGAAVGSFVTWKLVKDKYERIAQEEIDSVKETWRRMREKDDDRQNENGAESDEEDHFWNSDDDDEAEETMTHYHDLANLYRMGRDMSAGEKPENGEEGEKDQEVPIGKAPYVIPPEDFGDGNYDHELHCLTYYADGVLANDWYETLDIDDTVGDDTLEHIGDYAEDVIHVRNERLQADYEIVRDYRNFADVVATDPVLRAYGQD